MAENVIPRKYNYNLETGTVGTDDDDMANILYNINRMEMNASYQTSKLNDMQKVFGDSFFMTVDSGSHLKKFFSKHEGKLKASNVDSVQAALNEAIIIFRTVPSPQTDIELMSSSIKNAYKKLLDAVPSLIQLDEQSL